MDEAVENELTNEEQGATESENKSRDSNLVGVYGVVTWSSVPLTAAGTVAGAPQSVSARGDAA
jgi:hypothetical protein